MASNNGAVPEAARSILEEGLQPVPVPAKQKGLNTPGWTEKAFTLEDFKPGMNLGIRHDNVACVDRDCVESYRIRHKFLPRTRMDGKKSTPEAHAWYNITEGGDKLRYKEYFGPDGKTTLELRWGSGHQTLTAPSIHPETGEPYVLANPDTPIASVSAQVLQEALRKEAAAVSIAQAYPPEGGQYHFGLYLAGYLQKELGLDGQTCYDIMEAAYEAAGYHPGWEDLKNIRAVCQTTMDKLAEERGDEVAGRIYLEDRGYEDLVKNLASIYRARTGLTYKGQKLTGNVKKQGLFGNSKVTGTTLGSQESLESSSINVTRNSGVGEFQKSPEVSGLRIVPDSSKSTSEPENLETSGGVTHNSTLIERVMSYPKESTGAPRAISLGSLAYPGPQAWVAKDYVPKGHATTIYGMGGVAKSILAMHFGIHVSSPVLDRWLGIPVETMPVLYADWELDVDDQVRRAIHLSNGLGLPGVPEGLYHIPYGTTPLDKAAESLLVEYQNLGIGVIIIDSVGFALHGSGNDDQIVLEFQKHVINPLRAEGVTILQVDHQSKIVKGENYGDKEEYGSVYKRNTTRSSFQLQEAKVQEEVEDVQNLRIDTKVRKYVTINHRKANFGPKQDPMDIKLTFDNRHSLPTDTITIEPVQEGVVVETERPLADSVLVYLRGTEPQTVKEIATALDKNEQSVRNCLNRDLQGRVIKLEEYSPVKWWIAGVALPEEEEDDVETIEEEVVEAMHNTSEITQATLEPTEVRDGDEGPLYPSGDLFPGPTVVPQGEGPIAVDIETTGLNPQTDQVALITYQFSDGDPQIVRPDEPAFQGILEAMRTEDLIFHNAAFDLAFLKVHYGFEPEGRIWDTYILSQLVYAGDFDVRTHNLGDVVKRELTVELPKDQATSDWMGELTQDQIEYAYNDVRYLRALKNGLLNKMKSSVSVVNLEMDLLPVMRDMYIHGIYVDQEEWTSRVEEAQGGANYYDSVLDEFGIKATRLLDPEPSDEYAYDHDFNWGSPQDVILVADLLGLKLPDTKDATLAKYKHPFIVALREHRKYSKRTSSFGMKWLDNLAEDGVVRPRWNQAGTDTGRFSCSKPNLQQIPREGGFRECFKPRPGYKFVVADYSQIELRVAAIIAGERKMVEAYAEGQDLHKLTASLVLGKPLDEVTKDDRQIAKSLNFGLLFGMGSRNLKQYALTNYGVELTEREASNLRDKWMKAYPAVREWHQRVGRQREYNPPPAPKTKYGRVRGGDPRFTEAVNMPVQGLAADGLKLALVDIHQSLPEARICMVVHDEVVIEVPEGKAEEFSSKIQEYMESNMERVLNDQENLYVPVVAEPVVNPHWEK